MTATTKTQRQHTFKLEDAAKRTGILFLLLIFTVSFSSSAFSHSVSPDTFVRVVSANPDTRTYTFSCEMDPENNYLRDWFIRPDDGNTADDPNEAAILDKQSGEFLTYTFNSNSFYHVGCIIVKEPTFDQLYRGDLHIDLRNSAWNPEIIPLSGDGLTATFECRYSGSDYNVAWEYINAQTHERFSIPGGKQLTHSVSGHGLYDYICHVTDNTNGNKFSTGLPVEYFDQGKPYFPDKNGVPDDIKNVWIRGSPPACTPSTEVCDSVDNDCDSQVDEGNVCGSSGGTCYSNMQSIPATCEGGTITSDSFNGARIISCNNGGNSLTVEAWDKPTSTNPNYFEMYKKALAGSGIKICIGQACIKNEGYVKSSNYPICTGSAPPTCTPSTEVCDSVDNDCDSQVDEGNVCGSSGGTCYSNMQSIPATCEGTVTSDTYDGCRKITCSSSSNNMQILACDKPTSSSPSYFEIYRQTVAGNPLQICIGQACIKNEGYVKSSNYPICTGSAPPTCTPSTEVCDSVDNDCDSQVDEGNVCGSAPTCYSRLEDVPVTCNGGTIQSDNFNGCRNIVCSSSGSSLGITACNKPDTGAPQYFEVYKQVKTGSDALEICLDGACIKDNGYVKSSNYPICTSGGGSAAWGAPIWIAPSNGLTNVAPNYFHLELMQPDTTLHFSTDFEVWKADLSQRVWSHLGAAGVTKFHAHAPDGVFENSLAGKTQLDYDTSYKTRARYKDKSGVYTNWGEWREFRTSSAATLNPSSPDYTAVSGFKVEKFAGGFDVPVHLAFAPNLYGHIPESQRPFLYVTELYGQIKVVYKDGSSSLYASNLLNFEPFGSITGGGQMGLVGLYVDDATGDLFVGLTYVENDQVKNKVVRFFSTDNGLGYTGTQTIINGLPSSPSHQVEQITKGPDGKLYVNLGDAQMTSYPQDNTKLAGKILRMNMDGTSVEIYAKGFRNPFGADWRPGFSQLFVTDNSPDTGDRLLKVSQGGNYGWCCDISQKIFTLGVSPADLEFNPGNAGFPAELNGRMYVAVMGPIYQEGPNKEKRILEFILDSNGNVIGNRTFVKYTGDGYGTPIGLDFGPDGLYFTDIYGEPGFVGLGETEANIYRIVPGTPNPEDISGSFRAGISVVPWYPKNTGSGIEYIFECKGIDGSSNYKYDFDFGNGYKVYKTTWDRQRTVYPYGDRDYTVSCTVHDQVSLQSKSASMVINPSDFIAG